MPVSNDNPVEDVRNIIKPTEPKKSPTPVASWVTLASGAFLGFAIAAYAHHYKNGLGIDVSDFNQQALDKETIEESIGVINDGYNALDGNNKVLHFVEKKAADKSISAEECVLSEQLSQQNDGFQKVTKTFIAFLYNRAAISEEKTMNLNSAINSQYEITFLLKDIINRQCETVLTEENKKNSEGQQPVLPNARQWYAEYNLL